MSNTTFLNIPVSPSKPMKLFVEKDFIIIRDATTGMLDFSNPECYSGASPVAAYANMKNLVHNGANATNGPAPRVLEGGMLKFDGTEPSTNDYVLLPTDEFSLPAGCKRALISVALKLPASGYGSPAANRYPLFFGRLNNTAAANINFGIWGIINTSGDLTSVQGALLGSVPVSATAQLATLTDGSVHVVSVYADGETTAGTLVTRIYVDNTLLATATNSAWDGVVPQPTNLPRIGSYPATIHSPWGGMQVGRPMIVNLTGKDDNAEEIIRLETERAKRFLM
ncbi:hypothetical protein JEK20_10280 [Klebsiella quasipneumoniae]|uniref:hypothetical protein n=1 Tax=Klebsiella quasipneumoniae TaxID=1463165 RepID=UPI00210978EC|nr:hypothetical protein [Klebsiella quasipneumoniae]MCQ3894255.1 hypothetical protein [Klebsiella quasipneumoniae]